eukprot:1786511-Pleurochrysis_carterae.AAC.1
MQVLLDVALGILAQPRAASVCVRLPRMPHDVQVTGPCCEKKGLAAMRCPSDHAAVEPRTLWIVGKRACMRCRGSDASLSLTSTTRAVPVLANGTGIEQLPHRTPRHRRAPTNLEAISGITFMHHTNS